MVREQEAMPDIAVKITGLHHGGVPCNNLERAVEFYTRVLGMELEGISEDVLERHYKGSGIPAKHQERLRSPEGEHEFEEFHEMYQRERPNMPRPNGRFARMKAGNFSTVLFERLEPEEVSNQDMVLKYGIYHTSYHISPADMDRLIEAKRRGDSGIRFHSGPALRWPRGRAIYLFDSEGNYLELESEDDGLPAQYGIES